MYKFANRLSRIKTSEIREILKLTAQEDVISFAGGLPAPELFPVDEMKEVSLKVLETMGQEALQYSTTEGYNPLREQIVKRMKQLEVDTTINNILITNGSQQGLEFSGKIFLDPDDVVICESPTYLGAIKAFEAYECQFREVVTDCDGMVMDDLIRVIEENPKAKLIYVIPDFQNPSGRTWSLKKRKQLVEIANRYNLVIVEDNPYGALRYEGESLPTVKSFDTEERVVFLGTFSKTFAPGIRIGWVCAGEVLLQKYIMVKQGADLQSNSMSQRELAVYMEKYSLDNHIDRIKTMYKNRRDVMVGAMNKFFPDSVKYDVPKGGLFIWVTLPEYMDSVQLMIKAVEQKVAYVPGSSFYPNKNIKNTLRLNFSNMDEARIVEGIKRIGRLIYAEI